ncbi:hypothetical protein BC829DRAFT_385271 [Chytridium lagenaria]|nr:hypothetical protein BC829DRAFT_385271 [Chytridium lagenaria]
MEDVIRLMSTYLGPWDLVRLSITSRLARTWLTYELVFRSILCHGTKSGQKSLDIIMSLARSGKIWVPSPQRLLRIAIARRCERGTIIFKTPGGGKIRGRPCPAEVHHARQDYGLMLCWNCTQELTTLVKLSRQRDLKKFPMTVLMHPRMAAWGNKEGNQKSTMYIWTSSLWSVATSLTASGTKVVEGERIGPIMTVTLLEELIRNAIASDTSVGPPSKAVVKHLTPEKFMEAVSDFFASKKGIEMGVGVMDEPNMKRLMNWFDHFNPFATEFREQEKAKQKKAKQARLDVKKGKFEALEEKLVAMLLEGVGLPSSTENGPNIPAEKLAFVQASGLYKKFTGPMAAAPSQTRTLHLVFLARLIRRAFKFVFPSVQQDGFKLVLPDETLADEALQTSLGLRYNPFIVEGMMEEECLLAVSLYTTSSVSLSILLYQQGRSSGTLNSFPRIVLEKIAKSRIRSMGSPYLNNYDHKWGCDLRAETQLLNGIRAFAQQTRKKALAAEDADLFASGKRKRKLGPGDTLDRVEDTMKLVPSLEFLLRELFSAVNTKLEAFSAVAEETLDRIDELMEGSCFINEPLLKEHAMWYLRNRHNYVEKLRKVVLQLCWENEVMWEALMKGGSDAAALFWKSLYLRSKNPI